MFAIGCILYEMLSGGTPYVSRRTGETATLAAAPGFERIEVTAPASLVAVCRLVCLRDDPSQRYTNGNQLSDELGRFLGESTKRASSRKRSLEDERGVPRKDPHYVRGPRLHYGCRRAHAKEEVSRISMEQVVAVPPGCRSPGLDAFRIGLCSGGRRRGIAE